MTPDRRPTSSGATRGKQRRPAQRRRLREQATRRATRLVSATGSGPPRKRAVGGWPQELRARWFIYPSQVIHLMRLPHSLCLRNRGGHMTGNGLVWRRMTMTMAGVPKDSAHARHVGAPRKPLLCLAPMAATTAFALAQSMPSPTRPLLLQRQPRAALQQRLPRVALQRRRLRLLLRCNPLQFAI
jgi:hypothetical protein